MINMQSFTYQKPIKISKKEPPTYAQLKKMYDEIRRTNQYQLLSKVHSLMPEALRKSQEPTTFVKMKRTPLNSNPSGTKLTRARPKSSLVK